MEKVRKIVESLIEKLGVEQTTTDITEDNGVWKIAITTSDERALVGHDNERFDALTHLLKRMLARDLGEEVKIVVDINGMRAKKEEELKAKAGIIADRARAFKIDVEMDPMSSYERMVVHSHLEGAPNIKTESIGEGHNRRLVVKYIED